MIESTSSSQVKRPACCTGNYGAPSAARQPLCAVYGGRQRLTTTTTTTAMMMTMTITGWFTDQLPPPLRDGRLPSGSTKDCRFRRPVLIGFFLVAARAERQTTQRLGSLNKPLDTRTTMQPRDNNNHITIINSRVGHTAPSIS